MIYYKTLLIITVLTIILNSPYFVTYYNINYGNLIFIVGPIIGIALLFTFLMLATKRRFDPVIFSFRLNENMALFLSFVGALSMALDFDIKSFISGNLDVIRGNYIDREVSIFHQIAPLLLVYPFIYISYTFLNSSKGFKLKHILILLFLIFFGLATGGRAFIFEIFFLFFLIRKPNIFSKKYFPLFIAIVLLFSFITIGRQSVSTLKYSILEAGAPLKFNKVLKDHSEYAIIKDIFIEFVFYFGQGIPAFCNKFDNLELTILPRSVLGLQPFVERQAMRLGIYNHTQKESYDQLTDLSRGSGFFKLSWSTGFLDIYYHEGIIFSFIFFILVSLTLFITHRNLVRTNEPKYQVLTGYNLLFIITIFMTPAFMETIAFFSFLIIFFTKIIVD